MDVIAEYLLHLRYSDGKMVPVRMRLSRPIQRPTGIWECAAEIEGGLRLTYTGGHPIPTGGMGSTSWQALISALRSLYSIIRIEGGKLYEQSGRYPIHFDELFPFPRDGEAAPPPPE
jgi:hypothetical protein